MQLQTRSHIALYASDHKQNLDELFNLFNPVWTGLTGIWAAQMITISCRQFQMSKRP